MQHTCSSHAAWDPHKLYTRGAANSCEKRISAKPENRCVVVTEAGSYSRLIDFFITQLKAQGPSRTCNESKEEEEAFAGGVPRAGTPP